MVTGELLSTSVRLILLSLEESVLMPERAKINEAQAEQLLLAQGLSPKMVLEQLPEACLITDCKGRILWANLAAERFLGSVSKHVQVKTLSVYVPIHEQAKMYSLLRQVQYDAAVLEESLTIKHQGGGWFTASCTLSPMRTSEGAPVCLWVVRDASQTVLDSKRIAELDVSLETCKTSMEQMISTAETALMDKNVFIAHLVHEVRTPLQATIGAAELLQRTTPSAQQAELIRIISVAARQLKDVVDAALAFTRVELGQPKAKSEIFDLQELLDDLIGQFHSELLSKQLFIRKSVAQDVPELVMGDQLRVRQVIVNLLANAIKFTTTGGITIEISRFRKSDELLFCVADTGSGMTEDVLRNLFEPFTSTNRPASRSHGGTALGLYICKTLVESMGGRIAADSSIEKGTRMMFTVSLPPSGPKTGGQRPAASDDAKGNLSQLKVLLVEDSDLTARIVAMQLASLGCQVERVADGAAAVETVRSRRFDLVLMDCHMPVLDGFAAALQIRQLPDASAAQVPIIALTASTAETDRDRCLKSGMDDFLAKPVVIAQLREALSTWLDQQRRAYG